MSSASSLRSMSTASSGLSSLSTYVPLAGGKSGLDAATMLYAAAAAYTVLANCDAKEMKCDNPTAVAAAGLVGAALFLCKKDDCQFDLGLGKMNGQNMLLGGLVAYAIVLALRQAQFGITDMVNKVIPVSEEQLAMAFIGAGALVGAMMK